MKTMNNKLLSEELKKDDMIVLMMDNFKVNKMLDTLYYYRNMAIRLGVEFEHGRYDDVIAKE